MARLLSLASVSSFTFLLLRYVLTSLTFPFERRKRQISWQKADEMLGTKSGSSGTNRSLSCTRVDDECDGALGIICSSYELLRDHTVTSTWILLTIVLPAAIAMLLNHCFFYTLAHKFLPYPRPPPHLSRPDVGLLIIFGVVLLVLGFTLTVNLVAAIFYLVSVVCTGTSITFKDVLRALPGQWKGVAVTGLWGQLFLLGVALVLILSQILIMMLFDVSRIPLAILIMVTFLVSRAFLFLLVTTLEMAFAVTVFEKDDGLRTFVRGWKILKHKWCVALGIFVLVEVPKTLLGDALSLIPKSEQTLDAKIVYIVMVIILTSLLTLLGSVSYALFYKSCDYCAYNENLDGKAQFQICI